MTWDFASFITGAIEGGLAVTGILIYTLQHIREQNQKMYDELMRKYQGRESC